MAWRGAIQTLRAGTKGSSFSVSGRTSNRKGGRELALRSRRGRDRRAESDIQSELRRHLLGLFLGLLIFGLGATAVVSVVLAWHRGSGGFLAIILMAGMFTLCGIGILVSEWSSYFGALRRRKRLRQRLVNPNSS